MVSAQTAQDAGALKDEDRFVIGIAKGGEAGDLLGELDGRAGDGEGGFHREIGGGGSFRKAVEIGEVPAKGEFVAIPLALAALDRAVATEGWKIVGLTRLSPAFPFTLLNYAFGLTQVSLRDYVFASWIGMMPGTVMYVYLGSLARAAGEMEGSAAAMSEEVSSFSIPIAPCVSTLME